MDVLKDIIKQSKYKPVRGLKSVLYQLIKDKDYNRDQVKAHFEKSGKISQLRVVQANLQESLLDSILTTTLYSLPSLLRNRFKVWKKQLQVKILLQTGSKLAGVKLAIDTIPLAEKQDEFEVVHALCKELINQFSISQPNTPKYQKYRAKMEEMEKLIAAELTAEKLYNDLWHHYNSKKEIGGFGARLLELDKLVGENDKYKFRYFYYSAKSFYYQLTKSNDLLVENNQAAYQFFDSLDRHLHYAIQFNFLSALIPYYILQKDFAQAQNTISLCIHLPPLGSYNWHYIKIYECLLGLYSQKPKIALRAYQQAQLPERKFDDTAVAKKWHQIKGYLSLYVKLGLLDCQLDFKLSKWVNIDSTGETDLKANLIVVELLHLLADKNYQKFLPKTEQIESFISAHFKGHDYKRTRYFLRMLRSVVKGNYRASLVSVHAAKNLGRLVTSGDGLEVAVLDREVVRYEILWDMVLKQL